MDRYTFNINQFNQQPPYAGAGTIENAEIDANAVANPPNGIPTGIDNAAGQPGPSNHLQLAYDHNGVYQVDTQGPDLLPYQVWLLQNADGPTLQRYKDRIVLAYRKSLNYVGRSNEDGERAVAERLSQSEETGLRQMAVSINVLFASIYGPTYQGEVMSNAMYMGGQL